MSRMVRSEISDYEDYAPRKISLGDLSGSLVQNDGKPSENVDLIRPKPTTSVTGDERKQVNFSPAFGDKFATSLKSAFKPYTTTSLPEEQGHNQIAKFIPSQQQLSCKRRHILRQTQVFSSDDSLKYEPRTDQDFLEADIRRDVFSQSNDPDVSSNRRPTCNVQLARIREEHLLKKKVLKHAAMPELAETSETESVKGGSMDSGSETPSDKDHPVFPSLPDPVLKKLGLLGDDGESAENLSEQELEEKFAMLSLSFKTDRLTLDQRVQLQERARDMAEQNVDKELKSVKESLKLLGQQCVTSEGREVLAKVQRHVEVLEQSTARVSSRAELHGAVQQEGRLSRAIEIMVQHVETIKQAYERKDQELEETRQLLQENRIIPPSGSTDYGDGHPGFSKRSMSVAGGAAKMGRRRASVAAFPRLFGGVGQSGSTMIGGPRRFSADPRSRLQPTFSTTARTCSLEQKDQKQTPENVKNLQVKPSVEKPLSDCNKDANANEKKTVDWGPEEKEQIFQKGFEQGMRTGLSQDLNGFREQQAAFGEGLEELMDLNDLPDEEDEEFETETLLEKVWQLVPEWDKLGHKLRLLLVGLVAFMAVISIIYTVMPSLSPVQASQCRPCWSKSLADSLLNMYTTKQWIMKPPT